MVRTIAMIALTSGMLASASPQPAGKPHTVKGLEVTVSGVERASSASLKDCPPGANIVRGMTKPGEQFAIVTLAFKVLPGFQPGPIKRPVLTDAAGTAYNTAVSFVDVGSVPEFACAFPFRTPEGAKLKALQIETLSIELSGVDAKKP